MATAIALFESRAVPMLIPPMDDEKDMQRVLNVLDGVLFIGGADLDTCRRDGSQIRARHPSMWPERTNAAKTLTAAR